MMSLNPASSAIAITPGASRLQYQGQDVLTRALVIGGPGNITITMGGVSIQYAVVAGQVLPVRASHVTAATATGIVALL